MPRGTNCDAETARALESTDGPDQLILPVSQLDRDHLEGVSLVVFSGGFSYGDYIMSGRVARLITEQRIASALEEFRDRGGHSESVTASQILTQMGLLPAGSLVHNTSGRFLCRWAGLDKRSDAAPLSFLPDHFELPVAHAEGRFVTADPADAERYHGRSGSADLHG
ncbi:MAG: phosphoribosylformylglycinamidine synthase subunit PurQ [Verrucomicrobiales bacterium]